MDPLATVNTRQTSQNQRADPSQVKNNAGGYTFQVDDETRVNRFLTLGTTGGTYYVGEKSHTQENVDVILDVARDPEKGLWLVNRAVEISRAGRAPKQQPAIFALAAVAAHGDESARKHALGSVDLVCRTGSMLFQWNQYAENMRGWGRARRRAIANWYLDKDIDTLAYQVVKYRSRYDWTHRDLLRLAHPKPGSAERDDLFKYIVGNRDFDDESQLPSIVTAFEEVQATDDLERVLELITEHRLSWEMIPDRWRKEEVVWRALVGNGMPQGALLRQLPTLTRRGVFNNTAFRTLVAKQIANQDRLLMARIHPASILLAMRTYAFGQSMMGDSTWTPDRRIIDALDEAFYLSFGSIEAAHKRTLIALDVSGSMICQVLTGGSPGRLNYAPLSAREASAAMAMATIATEPHCDVVGFTGSSTRRSNRSLWYGRGPGVSELAICPRQRLDDLVKSIAGLDFGPTDCSLPMTWALEKGRQYDTFVIYTDNETWRGDIHPHQALQRYRERTGIDAKLIVVAMTSTGFSIADPKDPGMLDIAGFDSAVPNLISDFSRGDV
jgi:60 kDa SS-A/Ro ribonucleoprotein